MYCFQPVLQIVVREGRAVGVRLQDNTEVWADTMLSNATPKVTFLDLLDEVSVVPCLCIFKGGGCILFSSGNTEQRV